MKHLAPWQWKLRHQARRAARQLDALASGTFAAVAEPTHAPEPVRHRLLDITLEGFNGYWPVCLLDGEVMAVMPAQSARIGDCTAVPGVDRRGQAGYVVFGAGDRPFRCLDRDPLTAVLLAREATSGPPAPLPGRLAERRSGARQGLLSSS